ncbi:MAG: SUF system Fe-S cluster assembly regulator [Proteobacteria bacterium]|nr:MAG: SUF system Fe-S cluster assembly regulator [Pseudomonadota bacterium]
MIKMARLTEYGFMLIMALKKTSEPVSADDLARRVGLELPTVSKILKQLRKAGLLDSKRGSKGGYFLIKRKRDISLHEVIEAMEGRLALTECADDQGHCNLISHCYMSAGMRRVNQVISQALQNVTVSEIMDEHKKITLQIKP